MRHEALLDCHRNGFPPGFTAVTREGEPGLDSGIDFGICVQTEGRVAREWHIKESIWVLLDGDAEVRFGDAAVPVSRRSLFEEPPTVLHLGPETWAEIRPRSARVEWAVLRATCASRFTPRLYPPEEVATEDRGRGLAQGACVRVVRTVLDHERSPESGLVVGEVVTYPGRWSSYPPHAHRQPELYHYRFTLPQGYGHAELGDEVLKVRPFDTVKIMGGKTHAQVAAPGYGMWYLWAVRHLREHPYTGFDTAPEHSWMLDPRSQGWEPRS
jgi:5-deoxy-glucuronate isomerase